MKAVLISVQPKWCELIASGKKTIEVRKTRPKINTPFKGYIYCTNNGEILIERKDLKDSRWPGAIYERVKGKVIGEFVCDKVYSIKNQGNSFVVANEEQGVTNEIARQSCLEYDDMVGYLGNKDGYGLHITALKIYNKPKELSEFCIPCKVSCENCKNPLYFECSCEEKGKKIITRPPQSWCYVEERK